jgi:hypothetical protein
MTRPRARLKRIQLDELSLVDRPANPLAQVTLFKRDGDEGMRSTGRAPASFRSFDEAVEHLRKVHGVARKAEPEPVAKFNSIVDAVADRDGCPRSQAMRRAARENPDKFAAYQAA